MKHNACSSFGLLAFLLLLVGLNPGSAHAQINCIETPEGRICTLTQEIRQGIPTPVQRQQELGLVTIAGGCSGTLVNRFWVLTADRPVTFSPATRRSRSWLLSLSTVRVPFQVRLPTLSLCAIHPRTEILPPALVSIPIHKEERHFALPQKSGRRAWRRSVPSAVADGSWISMRYF